jgi:hypothetical protein
MHEHIEVGFHAFIEDGTEEFGAVRAVSPQRREVTVYVENAGDFVIAAEAIVDVHDEKVIFDATKLEPRLQSAIGHAHDAEDPRF